MDFRRVQDACNNFRGVASMDPAVAVSSPGLSQTTTIRNRGDGMTKGGGNDSVSLPSVASASSGSGQLSSQNENSAPVPQHQDQHQHNSSSALSSPAAPSSRASVEESHAHLSSLLDELVQLRQMSTVMSEQLAEVTQERNGLKVERDQLLLTTNTRDGGIRLNASIESSSQLLPRSSSAAVEANSCETELMRREMESLRVMNDQLTEENHRLLTERNNSVISNSRSSSNLAGSLGHNKHNSDSALSRENDLEYSALCAEVADLRASSKELEMENQELSNDMHDMMIEVEELHRELDAKEKEIDSLKKENMQLATDRDQIADKLWAHREKVVDSSNYEEMIEKAKQQNQAKMASLCRDKLLVEEKLSSVSQERDRLQTRVERLSEELDSAEATIAESKKSIAKWKRVAGIISKEVSHTTDNEDGTSNGTDDRRHYHRNNHQRHQQDDDDDDSISVCTMQTYHATSELEKCGGGSRRKGGRRGSVSKKRGTRRDSDSSARSVFNTNTLKEVTKNALSLTGLEDGFAPHKRLSEFAQSSSSFLSSVRSVSSRSNFDEPGIDSDDESILMYPSLGSISGK